MTKRKKLIMAENLYIFSTMAFASIIISMAAWIINSQDNIYFWSVLDFLFIAFFIICAVMAWSKDIADDTRKKLFKSKD